MSDTLYFEKYLEATKRKHYFYGFKHISAICGVSDVYQKPYSWLADKEGLASRKLCQRCKKIREK